MMKWKTLLAIAVLTLAPLVSMLEQDCQARFDAPSSRVEATQTDAPDVILDDGAPIKVADDIYQPVPLEYDPFTDDADPISDD